MKDPNELFCVCMDVRRSVIETAIIKHKLTTIEGIEDHTEAGANCGACHGDLENILIEVKQNGG